MTAPIEHEILHRPDLALLRVVLQPGQKIFAEPTAMASMDPQVELRAGLKGGILKSVGRAFGGESMIVNTYTTKGGPGEIMFAPGPMGDLQHYRLQGTNLMLQRGAFVAHGEGVEVGGKWQGMRGFFSGEGLVLLRATGQGDLFFNTYGAIIEVDVSQEYYVDTGYIVAFEETLSYKIETMPGLGIGKKLKSFIFGGEGLVCRFQGQGKLWIQTRAVNPFLAWVYPYRPAPKRS
ncbi:MAG: TIGR00266 family protein [Myxococcales bacterium]|nr:TIGR00266 family protein [Myxococcales bacterium]